MEIDFTGLRFKRVIWRFDLVRNKKFENKIKIVTNPIFEIYIPKICKQR
jgi:hypothetical protein